MQPHRLDDSRAHRRGQRLQRSCCRTGSQVDIGVEAPSGFEPELGLAAGGPILDVPEKVFDIVGLAIV
jgi:hypothetical protein